MLLGLLCCVVPFLWCLRVVVCVAVVAVFAVGLCVVCLCLFVGCC